MGNPSSTSQKQMQKKGEMDAPASGSGMKKAY
jgi:hypothetical protein